MRLSIPNLNHPCGSLCCPLLSDGVDLEVRGIRFHVLHLCSKTYARVCPRTLHIWGLSTRHVFRNKSETGLYAILDKIYRVVLSTIKKCNTGRDTEATGPTCGNVCGIALRTSVVPFSRAVHAHKRPSANYASEMFRAPRKHRRARWPSPSNSPVWNYSQEVVCDRRAFPRLGLSKRPRSWFHALTRGIFSDVDHGLVARARILAEQELGPRRR